MGRKHHARFGVTERQTEVLTKLKEGASFVDIADELGVSSARIRELVGLLVEKGLAYRVEG